MKDVLTIAYIANVRMPTEKAHGFQIARVCSELASLGHKVTLYVPLRDNHITTSLFAFYGIPQNFSVVTVKSLNVMKWVRFLGPLASLGHSLFFTLKVLRLNVVSRDAVVYSRDAEILWMFGMRGFVTIWNAHNWTKRPRIRKFFLSRVKGVVCNSEGTRAVVSANMPSKPVVVIENASDPNPYIERDVRALRNELNLPLDAHIALYAGHLYSWKGSEVMMRAALFLREKTVIVCVGGTSGDVEKYRKKALETGVSEKIYFVGHKPKEVIPKYLCAADVLLLPNTNESEESVEQTSPLKLFEYLASGRPIIASNLPSISRILPPASGIMISPSSPEDLADAIEKIRHLSSEGREMMRRAALVFAEKHTWRAHAEQAASFFENNLAGKETEALSFGKE